MHLAGVPGTNRRCRGMGALAGFAGLFLRASGLLGFTRPFSGPGMRVAGSFSRKIYRKDLRGEV